MILLLHLKFCWCILNFAGTVFQAKVMPAKDSCQQNSAGVCQKIPSLHEEDQEDDRKDDHKDDHEDDHKEEHRL
jgi:hypothetical protein